MASFTSNPIQYKDYVAVNPVEAMTLVGTQRQQELKQGIQKVSDYLTRVAGVDVIRDVDKQNIQNRLNGLKEGVTKKLSGDFSDNRIVNQITGAATQIYKDPLVQNAINSTSAVRKGQTEMEEFRKAGKSSVAQEYVFNKSVENYVLSTDATATFNGKAKQYSDYKKRAVEGFKAMTGDESITDDAFINDGAGHLVLDNETIRRKYAGIKPQQIQSMLMNYLTPDDFDQIAAEGRYNYSNKSDQDFASDLQQSYQDKYNVASDYIKKLEAQKTKTTDTQTISKIDETIARENSRIESIKNDYNSITISGDIESAKAQKATFDFIHGFANTFANEQRSTTYQGKTPQENIQWRQEFEQKANQFNITKNWEREKFGIEREFNERKLLFEIDKEAKANPSAGAGGWLVPRSQSEIEAVTPSESTVGDEIKLNSQALDLKKDQFMVEAQSKGLIPEGASDEWYKDQRSAWILNPKNVDASVAHHFNEVIDNERKVGAMQKTLAAIQKEAEDQYGIKNFIPKGQNITFGDSKEQYTYSPTDFVNSISKFKDLYKEETTPVIGSMTGGTRTVLKVDKTKVDKLAPKDKFLFEKYIAKDKAVVPYVENYTKAIIVPHSKSLEAKNKLIEQRLAEKFTAVQSGMYTIPTNKGEQQRQAAGLISGFAEVARSYNGALPMGTEYNEADATALADDSKTHYQIKVNSGSTFDPAAYSIIASNGKLRTVIPMSLVQKRNLMGNDYENVKAIEFDRKYGEVMQMSGGNTTSIGGSGYLVTKDFNNLNSFGTVGNIIKVGENYQFDLQVRDPIDNKLKPVKIPQVPASKEKIIDARNTLTDEVIFELLYSHSPSAKELEILNKAAKTNTSN